MFQKMYKKCKTSRKIGTGLELAYHGMVSSNRDPDPNPINLNLCSFYIWVDFFTKMQPYKLFTLVKTVFVTFQRKFVEKSQLPYSKQLILDSKSCPSRINHPCQCGFLLNQLQDVHLIKTDSFF